MNNTCQGECSINSECLGDVYSYSVVGNTLFGPMNFGIVNYCAYATALMRKHGYSLQEYRGEYANEFL